jgi:hypothetical protein
VVTRSSRRRRIQLRDERVPDPLQERKRQPLTGLAVGAGLAAGASLIRPRRAAIRQRAGHGRPARTVGQQHLPQKRQDRHGRSPEAIAPRVSDLVGQSMNPVLVEQREQTLTRIAKLML